MGMKIQTQMMGDVAVLAMSGDMDSRSNQQLDKTLKTLIAEGSNKVVLDVSSLRFIGNQTISILISNLKEMRAGGGNIKFLNPQRQVVDYLKQNRIFEIFDIYSSRTEAVESFRKESEARASSASAPNEDANADKNASASAGSGSSGAKSVQIGGSRPSAAERSKSASTAPAKAPATEPSALSSAEIKQRIESDEVLYANNCMLVTLIRLLEKKGCIESDEAADLLNSEGFSPERLAALLAKGE